MGLKYNEITGEFEEERTEVGYGDLVFDPVTGDFIVNSPTRGLSGKSLDEEIKSLYQCVTRKLSIIPGVTKIFDLNKDEFAIHKYETYAYAYHSATNTFVYSYNNGIIDRIICHPSILEEDSILKSSKSYNEWKRFFDRDNFFFWESQKPNIYTDHERYFSAHLELSYLTKGINIEFSIFEETSLDYASQYAAVHLNSCTINVDFTWLDNLIEWYKPSAIRRRICQPVPVYDLSSDGTILYGFNLDNYYGNSVVIIPEGIVSIADQSFCDNYDIEEVKCPKSLKFIGEKAFKGCSNLAKITLGAGLEGIEDGAFESTSLREVTIPAKVKHIGTNAFECHVKVSKTNKYYSSIDGALYSKDLSTLYRYPINDIPNNVTIAEGVKSIGAFAFSNCMMNSISLPTSVTLLKESCFIGCDMLQTATIRSVISDQLFEEKAFNRRRTRSTLYVNGQYLKVAKTLPALSRFKNIIAIPGTEVIDIISTDRVKSMMFPIDGLSIFNSRYDERLGYEYLLNKYIRTPEGHEFILKDGLITGVIISRHSSIPEAWAYFGLEWKLSFNKSIECLKKIGFNVTSQRWKVNTNSHYNRQYIVGEIKAETLEKDLNVTLRFDWDDDHPYSAPSTLDGPNGLTGISIIYNK